MIAIGTPNVSYAIGAFAVDYDRGDYEAGDGIAIGYDDEESAFEAAMALCAEAGNEHCRRISWFQTANEAPEMAMDKGDRDDCRIIATECEA